jgi:capsular exopolysaccharide synthesis family protein
VDRSHGKSSEDQKMSRIHRAVAKAEQEGLLTWTAGEGAAVRPPLSEPPQIDAPPRDTVRLPPLPDDAWTAGDPAAWAPSSDPALSPLLVAATAPNSPAAEQYRLLRTRLENGSRGRRSHFVLVTSPGAGDGKTVTSANLALTMAQEFHHTVVLVEADMRKPALAGLLGVRPEPGLVDVLVGAATLDEALVTAPGQNLFVLPAGLAAGRSTELLASAMMARVADALRSKFDRIVIDTPPVTLADTHVIARLADGVLMVVRSGVTPRPALEHALAGVDRERLIGMVLNEVDTAPGEYAYARVHAGGAGA